MCVADLYQFVKAVLPIGSDRIDRAFSGGKTGFSQWVEFSLFHHALFTFYKCQREDRKFGI